MLNHFFHSVFFFFCSSLWFQRHTMAMILMCFLTIIQVTIQNLVIFDDQFDCTFEWNCVIDGWMRNEKKKVKLTKDQYMTKNKNFQILEITVFGHILFSLSCLVIILLATKPRYDSRTCSKIIDKRMQMSDFH